ncbi:MAG: nucleoside 2-deoxyribosyltransferase [Candidatus Pacearchaeota archaeon]
MAKNLLYLANQLGFSETGRMLLKMIIPEIEKYFIVKEPFRDSGIIKKVTSKDAAKAIILSNRKLMSKAKIMAPILDGSHAVDDGIAGEIAEFSLKKLGPIIALRTDLRQHDSNFAINPQIEGYIKDSGGKICFSLAEWFSELRKLA